MIRGLRVYSVLSSFSLYTNSKNKTTNMVDLHIAILRVVVVALDGSFHMQRRIAAADSGDL